MDRDYIILGLVVAVLFIINLFISYTSGMDLFPVFNPDFCYDSYSPFWCFKAWSLIELTGICLILYYVVGRKSGERIRS